MEMKTACLHDVVTVLEGLFPSSTAQSWDQVGLVTGDLDQPIERILIALDPTLDVIADAVDAGANMLLTHHPLLLRGVNSVATTSGKGKAVTSLVVSDIALYCAHTNADVAVGGVSDALAQALGLENIRTLTVSEGQNLGRVGEVREPMTLRRFAERVAQVMPQAPVGIRVSGDPERTIERVAVLGGAGDSEFQAVRDAEADVYVTADLRHHPALEAREEVSARPLALIDAGHWATESLWLTVVAQQLRERLAAAGYDVSIEVSIRCTDPWTFTLPTSGARGETVSDTTTQQDDSDISGEQQ